MEQALKRNDYIDVDIRRATRKMISLKMIIEPRRRMVYLPYPMGVTEEVIEVCKVVPAASTDHKGQNCQKNTKSIYKITRQCGQELNNQATFPKTFSILNTYSAYGRR